MIYEWLKNIVFVWPENFILLGLIPFLIARYIRNERNHKAALLTSAVNVNTPSTFKTNFRHLPFVLRILALICLIMALARPQHQTDQTHAEGEGIDIVLCMDVSASMLTNDIKPSRFQVAKEVAAEFVKSRPVDRIGLVIFGGESFTKCPITSDKNTLLTQLQSLKIKDGGYLADGTLIGEGLAMAVNRVSKGSSKSRVVILLTDGKEEAPVTRIIDPYTATEIAKAENVKVYCIGLGSTEFMIEQMVKDNAGNTVRNDIDETLLTRIAAETGGKYFRATDKSSLQAIYSEIDQLEKSKVEIIRYKEIEEMFIPFVLLALGLLFIELLLRFTIFKTFP